MTAGCTGQLLAKKSSLVAGIVQDDLDGAGALCLMLMGLT